MLNEITQAIADSLFDTIPGMRRSTSDYHGGIAAAAGVAVIRNNRDNIAKVIKAEVDWGTHGVISPDCVDISEAATAAVVDLIGGD